MSSFDFIYYHFDLFIIDLFNVNLWQMYFKELFV